MGTYANRAFTALDTDGNGGLSPEESSPILSEANRLTLDRDGDGILSESEFSTQVMTDFENADLDGSGVLE
jgi:hypothetical protein